MRAWIRRSFQNRLFVSVLLITLVPLLLCDLLMIRIQVDGSRRDQYRAAQLQLEQMEEEFSWLRRELTRISQNLTQSTPLRSAIRKSSRDSGVVYQVLYRDTRSLREYAGFRLYDAQGSCLYSTEETSRDENLDPRWGILRAAGQSRQLCFQRGTGETALEAAQALRSHDGTVLGYLLVTVTQTHFEALFSGSYDRNGDVLLMDRFFQPVYSSRNSGADTTAEQLRQQLLSGGVLEDPDGRCAYFSKVTGEYCLVLQLPLTFTSHALTSLTQISLLLGLLSLALCLLYSLVLSRHLARPVHEMDQAMAAVRRGDYSARLTVDRQDELGRLAASFNRMTQEYGRNLERTVQHQQELNAVQVRMMQAQLNPHFLYNTLDSIKWLGISHQVPQIASMATDLAAVLRASISREEFYTLEQELELIDRYLQIQYLRFEDRFTCEADIPEQFQRCILPKLSLMPLVENAIIHAVADQDDGYIKITAWQEEKDLLLRVSDNGCGIPEEVLEQLNGPDKRLPGDHLGLYNVDRIARLHYGDRYGIRLQSQPGQGTQVDLRIPLVPEERGESYAESTGG